MSLAMQWLPLTLRVAWYWFLTKFMSRIYQKMHTHFRKKNICINISILDLDVTCWCYSHESKMLSVENHTTVHSDCVIWSNKFFFSWSVCTFFRRTLYINEQGSSCNNNLRFKNVSLEWDLNIQRRAWR